MAGQTDRRRLLKGASSLLALATLGGVASRDAQAPFYDARVADLYGRFEQVFYDGLRRV
ncbi:transcriptional initiation protein Tat [Burkholderia multivorans]|uniref:transcriptional initiation protein Tat n=1 Tax=Burkholderia multivorans TaxID=87883 RepID=UPI0020B2E4E4|nr:transcriptional initiation protein Tat [Burkholderia multivorans]